MRPIRLANRPFFNTLSILTKTTVNHTLAHMIADKKRLVKLKILLGFCLFIALAVGISLGWALAASRNLDVRNDLKNYKPALPTQILDRNGDLITELFAEEKREIVPIDELPSHLIYALLAREDANFYEHNGFSFKHFFRAAYNIIAGNYFSGFSTLTMQVAGSHYADRREITISRKIKEVWYALQIEKALSKDEILEIYVNETYFGHNTYGVEAASQFYFGHSARDITLAESAILVIQLASPALYSPINHPDTARARQIDVLDEMVELGYCTREEADRSFTEYWSSYDFSRSNIASAWFDNNSEAPYFSEYVRLRLNDMLYGAVDINKDGYTVHTTLDMDMQRKAREVMDKAYRSINQRYQSYSNERYEVVDKGYTAILDLLSLTFNMDDIQVAGTTQKKKAKDAFFQSVAPSLNVVAMMLGQRDLNTVSQMAIERDKLSSKKTTVEGALISLQNGTGHILTMVGGSDFETKQFNRAVDAQLQPGSSFKPLYYSAAISSRRFTPATRLYDGPIVFYDSLGNPYEPLNYLGEFEGSVLLRRALATSMNVPSIQVLDSIGFDAAIERASQMLGMYDQRNDETLFPHGYPLGLGVTATAPINMARAFSVFPNQGKAVDPIAVLSVEDREGNIILEPEKERLRTSQSGNGSDNQIMTPQTAYIMADILSSTVEWGTLRYPHWRTEGFLDTFKEIDIAGKTGTTQNWQDAWTVGFSPYLTTAIWFGFDEGGISLGRNLTGATATGYVWAEYMEKVHNGMAPAHFQKPENGLVKVRVCSKSGLLPTNSCNEGTVEEIFLTGTEPRQFCDIHKFEESRDQELIQKMQDALLIEDLPLYDIDLSEYELEDPLNDESGTADSEGESTEEEPESDDGYNPLLD